MSILYSRFILNVAFTGYVDVALIACCPSFLVVVVVCGCERKREERESAVSL